MTRSLARRAEYCIWLFCRMSTPLALDALPLLQHLPQVTLRHLEQHSTQRWLNKREVALHKDERPAALSFLLEGRLQGVDFTTDGREVGLYFVQPGDYFGEVALVDNGGQPEHVVAVARSRVLEIPHSLVRPLLFGAPRVAEALCQRLARRVRTDSAQRKILALANPLQRVCAQLQMMLNPDVGRVPDAPTHQELAMMINASRETVTRAFQLLQGRGIVEREGNDLLILQDEVIRKIAAGELDVSK